MPVAGPREAVHYNRHGSERVTQDLSERIAKHLLAFTHPTLRRFTVFERAPDMPVVVITQTSAARDDFEYIRTHVMGRVIDHVVDSAESTFGIPRLVARHSVIVTCGHVWRTAGGFPLPLALMTRDQLAALGVLIDRQLEERDDDALMSLDLDPDLVDLHWRRWSRAVFDETRVRVRTGEPRVEILDPVGSSQEWLEFAPRRNGVSHDAANCGGPDMMMGDIPTMPRVVLWPRTAYRNVTECKQSSLSRLSGAVRSFGALHHVESGEPNDGRLAVETWRQRDLEADT